MSWAFFFSLLFQTHWSNWSISWELLTFHQPARRHLFKQTAPGSLAWQARVNSPGVSLIHSYELTAAQAPGLVLGFAWPSGRGGCRQHTAAERPGEAQQQMESVPLFPCRKPLGASSKLQTQFSKPIVRTGSLGKGSGLPTAQASGGFGGGG